MRRLGWIVAGLVLLAVVEITVLILVGQAIGAGWTLLLVLAGMVGGVWLLRREGVRAWRQFRDEYQAGRPAGNAVTEGLLALAGGVLLIVPGFLTDIAGALLLIPPIRRLVRVAVLRRFGGRLAPDLAASLFGPRRVRARAGRPAQPADQPGGLNWDDAPVGDSTPIEGEIIDPR